MKKPNIFKIVKKLILSLINDDSGTTVLRVGNGEVQIDRDDGDSYVEVANISLCNDKRDKSKDSECSSNDDTESYIYALVHRLSTWRTYLVVYTPLYLL